MGRFMRWKGWHVKCERTGVRALSFCAKAQARPPNYNQPPKVTLTNPIALTSNHGRTINSKRTEDQDHDWRQSSLREDSPAWELLEFAIRMVSVFKLLRRWVIVQNLNCQRTP